MRSVFTLNLLAIVLSIAADEGVGQFVGVKRRVPQNYSTIQAAINASINGDTVLVSEGTYYENIRYRGKAITVGSLYVIDGDTSHIGRTTIDGSRSTQPDSGSVVFLIDGEDTTSVLCGLTIQGGTGTRYRYTGTGGPCWFRSGGGIFSFGAGARISRNIITRNRIVAQVGSGAGVHCVSPRSSLPYIILEGNHITDNYVQSDTSLVWGGGAGGGDLTGVDARVVGNTFERDSAVGYVNVFAGGLGFGPWDIGVRLPNGHFTGNVFRSNVIKATVGGAIGAGLALTRTGDVVVQNNLFEGNRATSLGVGGYAEGGGMIVTDWGLTGQGRKIVAKNRFINNSVDHAGWSDGAGIALYQTLVTLTGNYVSNNAVIRAGGLGGGGISIQYSSFRVENNIITGNSSVASGGGLHVSGAPQIGTDQLIVNNTFVDNHSTAPGAAMSIQSASRLLILNTIFWDDTSTGGEISHSGTIAGVYYCDVQGGYPGTGNISVGPMFLDNSYRLSDSSLCIGSGKDSLQISGVWYVAPDTCFHGSPRPDPRDSRPDIGACENPRRDPMVDVRELDGSIPGSYALEQNYPNPFNPSTTIRYALPQRAAVTLVVYNTLGQEVTTLVRGEKEAGYHEAVFDASGMASGVYFYRLQAGSFVETRKLLLLR